MKYKLLKDVSWPFSKVSKKGTINTVHGWLDEFGLDWLSYYEEQISDNPDWFEEVEC